MNLRTKLRKRRSDLIEGKASLEQRIVELETLLEQTKINLFATDGGLQECERWLHEIEKEDEHDSRDTGV